MTPSSIRSVFDKQKKQIVVRTYPYGDTNNELKKRLAEGWEIILCNTLTGNSGSMLEYILEKEE
jgi:hypothetical protein